MDSYEVRAYRPGDEEGIVSLLDLVFDGWPRFDLRCSPLEHWEWKYLGNPRGTSSVFVAERNGEVIGCYHSLPVQLKLGDRVLSCMRGYDAATHPEYRELGIMNRLHDLRDASEKARGIVFVPRGPSSPVMTERNVRRHPRFPHEVSVLFRAQAEHGLLKRARLRVTDAYRRSRDGRGSKRPQGAGDEVRTREVARFDERADLLWKQIEGHYHYINVRDSAYLNWRYCDSRAGDFVVRTAEAGESVIGYCVTRTNRVRADRPTGTVVDLVTLPGRPAAAEALLRDAVRSFQEQDVSSVGAWTIGGHPYHELLSRNGFRDIGQPLAMFYKVYDAGAVDDELEKVRHAPGQAILFSCGDVDWI